MARWATIALCALAGILLGCSTIDDLSEQIDDHRNPVSAEWAAAQTQVSHDDYRQTTSLRGPDVEERVDRAGSYYRAHLRGASGTNGAARFQIYVATHFEGEWRNLNTARDQDQIPVAVHKVTRKERCGDEGCAFYEHIAMPVTRMYLESRARDAIRLDVEGPGGAIHVHLPGAYVAGFLERLDQVEAARQQRPAHKTGAQSAYCESKFRDDADALTFCQKQARASYERLLPARQRARRDSFTQEARRLESCMRKHNRRLGIDWMMVEHCFQKSGGSTAPASR